MMDIVFEKLRYRIDSEWTEGTEVSKILENFEDVQLVTPNRLTDEEMRDPLLVEMWKEDVKLHMAERRALARAKQKLFATVWQILSQNLRSRISGQAEYEEKSQAKDPLWLVIMVREQVTNFDSSMPRVLSTRDSMERILTYRQGEKMDNAEYVKNLVALIKVFEQYSGTYGLYPKDLMEIDRQVEAATNENGGALAAPEKTKLKAEMIRSAREKAVATQIIAGADKKRYASLRRTLATMFGLKDNKYPVTIDGAINALNIHERQLPPHIKKLSGINLLQSGKEQVAGTDGKVIERITCHKCKNVGHYANRCPQAEPEAKAEKEESP